MTEDTTNTGGNPIPRTSLNVQMSTRDALMEIGKKSQSYDDIIIMLLACWHETHKDQKS
jgi:hypothetical protein